MEIFEIIKQIAWRVLPVDNEVKLEMKREKYQLRRESADDFTHLKVTAHWLIEAHSFGIDNGVSRGYKVADSFGFGPKGWQASYPETTGYIIPTFFAVARHLNNDSFAQRALKMADWEIDIQMEEGAVMGSVVTAKPTPAVFNTGQVIFGWLAAYKQTDDSKYIETAGRAGDYLLSVQASDGSWQKGDSNFALKGATTYNTRVAWALIELGIKTKKDKYILAGKKNIELALSKQLENGWFKENCLNDPENPLLHTIVYATRGMLESGICFNDSAYIDAAIKTLDALINCQRNNGGISGRLNSHWHPVADWDCLTGDAQVAIAWLRAHAITGEKKYKEAAKLTIDFVKKTQNLEHPNPGIRGGVKGSFPFDGEYGRFKMLNWAAKFFCDALMMASDDDLAKTGIKG